MIPLLLSTSEFERCQEKVHAGQGFKHEDCVEELCVFFLSFSTFLGLPKRLTQLCRSLSTFPNPVRHFPTFLPLRNHLTSFFVIA